MGTTEVRALLRQTRLKNNWTLDDVAERAKVGKSTVWRVEMEETAELPESATSVAKALGLELITAEPMVVAARYMVAERPRRGKASR